MKWLVVSSHDERYDFNLEIKTFEGTIEEFEASSYCDFKKENRESWRDGAYIYHIEERKTDSANIKPEVWDNIKKYVETVSFHTLYLIPFDNFKDINFVFQNGIVNRNLKFGFLDITN